MIIAVGLDIVEIKRIHRSLKNYKGRFRDKYFTRNEQSYCSAKAKPSQHYAARFAAKEAAFKALNGGWPEGCSHRDVEVVMGDDGNPEIAFSAELEKAFKNQGMKKVHVSLTHTKENAAAMIIIEG